MSANAGFSAPPRAGAWPMYRAMVGVGLLCGILIVTVFEVTKPVIARNRAEALRQAIFEVLPAAESSKTYLFEESGEFELHEGDAAGRPAVHAGYDGRGSLVGFAVEGRGMGYQDTIRLLFGYSFTEEAIVGLRVLESKETPGLGDKISTDEGFRENFQRLDVSLDADESGLEHRIEAVKHGKKVNAWEVDGITGATISSVAVSEILDSSASSWIPRIRARIRDFEEAR